jgi:hypothetical protein
MDIDIIDANANADKKKEKEKDVIIINDTITNTNDKNTTRKEKEEEEEKDDCISKASSEYFFRPGDPYLAEILYDAHNALVYCDSCDRMYHQKCHFVPVLTLPRGAWHCLLCSVKAAALQAIRANKNNKKRKKIKKKTPTKATKAGKGTKATKVTKANDNNDNDNDDDEEEQQLQVLLKTDDLFRSPPVAAARPHEIQWEWASRHYKAAGWRTELFQRLKQAVSSQLGNYRLGVTAAETLTSTQKNRRHFSHAGSQELAQTLVKLFGAKFKLREKCHDLEKVRRSSGKQWQRLQVWTDEWIAMDTATCTANNKKDDAISDFVERVLFPFGRQYPCRVDPRTPEMKLVQREQAAAAAAAVTKDSEKNPGVPEEIVVSATVGLEVNIDKKGKDKGSKRGKGVPSKSACGGVGGKKSQAASKKSTDNAKGDDDSGISLDDLKCCVCHQGTATDDNDLILCDGSGCYRAYHMKCCKPEVTAQDLEDENDDWFCPICSGLADLLMLIQGEYMGDEWEQRRYALQLDGKDTTGSVKSWDAVDDIFPDSEWEYETACLMKEGKRNTATRQLLAQVLGLESLPEDEDHDDVEEDAHFDPSVFDKERRRARKTLEEEEEADDDSSHSSQATLADMSSVELEIGKNELAALSEPEDEDDEEVDDGSDQEGENGSKGQVRRSRRIRKHGSTNASSDGDLGKFDESNIVKGKRGRKPVDYIKLNEAIFGDLPDAEAAKLDDTDDFEVKEARKKLSESSDDESGKEDNDDDDDAVDEKKDEDDQNPGASEEEPPRKKSRKQEPKEDRKKAAKVAKNNEAAASSTASPRSSGAKVKQTSPSIAQAALNMVSKLVGGEGRRSKR